MLNKKLLNPGLVAMLLIGLVLATTGCGGGGKGNETADADTLKLKVNEQMLQTVEAVIVTLPSPLEMNNLIKKSGANYNAAILNPHTAWNKYNDTYKKGLNMGIYGADLGYVAYFGKTQESINYLNSINKLGTSLNILGAFEMDKLKAVEKNISNQDSLLNMITTEFENADAHLKQTQRADVAALVLTGGWLEGLHMATQLQKAKSNEAIKTRIGELKLSLNSLLHLIGMHRAQPGFAGLEKEMLELRALYDKVEITYETKPATSTKDKAGDIVKVDIGTTSKVKMDDATLKAITAKVESIRKSIVS